MMHFFFSERNGVTTVIPRGNVSLILRGNVSPDPEGDGP